MQLKIARCRNDKINSTKKFKEHEELWMILDLITAYNTSYTNTTWCEWIGTIDYKMKTS